MCDLQAAERALWIQPYRARERPRRCGSPFKGHTAGPMASAGVRLAAPVARFATARSDNSAPMLLILRLLRFRLLRVLLLALLRSSTGRHILRVAVRSIGRRLLSGRLQPGFGSGSPRNA